MTLINNPVERDTLRFCHGNSLAPAPSQHLDTLVDILSDLSSHSLIYVQALHHYAINAVTITQIVTVVTRDV